MSFPRGSVALVAIAALIATGCGSSGEPSGPPRVRVATIGVSGAAAMVLGVSKGIFSDAGLDVQVVPAEAPAVIPSVVGGQAEVGFLNAPAVLLARSNGVPVTAISSTSGNPADPADNFIQLQVAADSPIRSPKDLEGRTIAVDTLYQLPDVSIRNALRASGVDVSKVKFTELPFASMPDALTSGKVDATNPAEPFVALGLDAGARNLLSDSVGQTTTMPQSVFLSSEKYVTANRDTIDKFRAALARACEYAQAHPDELRAVLPTYTKVPAALAGKIKLPVYTTAADPAGWQRWADVLTQQQIAKKPIDLDGAYLR
ncbi:ABC transporter substrate-binding protein [Actinoplanes cyaneus]|uniref:ABC transporter substrate-binding protein n=1 Tax=Actinoplanes cyaneus TaxID=52696 RepID=UPI001942CB5A|nr:ABC transporter substrate-binding protein [Actinoplanes cyaneus]MCW2136191.1 NitT/TauT family transport system substrate-binding protein [Actinoplanes cyaneus]